MSDSTLERLTRTQLRTRAKILAAVDLVMAEAEEAGGTAVITLTADLAHVTLHLQLQDVAQPVKDPSPGPRLEVATQQVSGAGGLVMRVAPAAEESPIEAGVLAYAERTTGLPAMEMAQALDLDTAATLADPAVAAEFEALVCEAMGDPGPKPRPHLAAAGGWAPADDLQLAEMYRDGEPLAIMADSLGRTPKEIRARWAALNPAGLTPSELDPIIRQLASRLPDAA